METPRVKRADAKVKLSAGYPLSDRMASMVSCIVMNIRNQVRLIEEMPVAAIEALLTYGREQHRQDQSVTDIDKAYKNVRAALLEYTEIALREARERERLHEEKREVDD
jgi:hypothetical protein